MPAGAGAEMGTWGSVREAKEQLVPRSVWVCHAGAQRDPRGSRVVTAPRKRDPSGLGAAASPGRDWGNGEGPETVLPAQYR